MNEKMVQCHIGQHKWPFLTSAGHLLKFMFKRKQRRYFKCNKFETQNKENIPRCLTWHIDLTRVMLMLNTPPFLSTSVLMAILDYMLDCRPSCWILCGTVKATEKSFQGVNTCQMAIFYWDDKCIGTVESIPASQRNTSATMDSSSRGSSEDCHC